MKYYPSLTPRQEAMVRAHLQIHALLEDNSTVVHAVNGKVYCGLANHPGLGVWYMLTHPHGFD